MIIEIKDLPNGQVIKKLDLHIDFDACTMSNTVTANIVTTNEHIDNDASKIIESSLNNILDTERSSKKNIADEMLNAEF